MFLFQRDQPGPVSWKPRKLFGPIKPFLVRLYLKTEKCIRLKPLVWREPLFILRIWDFATAFRVRKRFGTFEKRVPGLSARSCLRYRMRRATGFQRLWNRKTEVPLTDKCTTKFFLHCYLHARILCLRPCFPPSRQYLPFLLDLSVVFSTSEICHLTAAIKLQEWMNLRWLRLLHWLIGQINFTSPLLFTSPLNVAPSSFTYSELCRPLFTPFFAVTRLWTADKIRSTIGASFVTRIIYEKIFSEL